MEQNNIQQAGGQQPASEAENSAKVHPWRRFFARLIDFFAGAFILGFTIGMMLSDETGDTIIDSPFFNFILLFCWIFMESAFLITWGTTPGKWLLNITVRAADGSKLNIRQALTRSVSVWVQGIALGIPIIALITLILSYRKLDQDKVTYWDEKGSFKVTHGKIERARIIGIIVAIAMVIWLITLDDSGTVDPGGDYYGGQVPY